MAFLKTKLGTLRPLRRYSPVKLSVELLSLIGGQVQRTQDLKNLRLVCKLFNDIFAPVVLSHIRLRSFPLRDLTKRNESLAFVKSLTVYPYDQLAFQPESFHEHCRIAPYYFLLALTHPFRHLWSTKSSNNKVASVQGNYFLKKLILPNLESVNLKWYWRIVEQKTSTTLFLKVLALLPSLKELDLSLTLSYIKDLDSFMYLLAQVSGLEKLTLRLCCGHRNHSGSYLQWFGRLIANNPNLACLYFVWHDNGADLSPLQVFRHVPVHRPAQLKDLVLETHITSEPDMIPHLRSLQSLSIRWKPPPNFWETLALNEIFIPFLTVGFICEALNEYLLLNAKLVSFTIAEEPYNPSQSLGLFRALGTTDVAQITISPFNWAKWYENAEIKECLRQCAKLRSITLIFEGNGGYLPDLYKDIVSNLIADTVQESLSIFQIEQEAIIKTVPQLGDEISLEISADDDIHHAFRTCCQSKDPLTKSLQQRLVFLELQELKSSTFLFPWSY